MLPIRQRNVIRQRVHFRIRQKMEGTAVRPRLNVYRSLNHIYAQIIDDSKGETILSASTLSAKLKTGGNVAAAKEVGKLVAERAHWKRESRRWSSIAAAISTTGASRLWPMRHAKQVWSSKFNGFWKDRTTRAWQYSSGNWTPGSTT
jgi:large subunit ribosomal protein L18